MADRQHPFTALETEIDGKSLGIFTGMNNRRFAVTNFRELRSRPGIILRKDGTFDQWEVKGVKEIDGEIVVYGPAYKGSHQPADRPFGFEQLSRIDTLFRKILQDGIRLRRFSPLMLYWGDDGSVLFLPPLLMEFIITQLADEDALKWAEPYSAPNLEGPLLLSFILGNLSYQRMTGRLPFQAESDSEIHDRIREGRFIRPEEREPGIRPEVSDFVCRSISTERQRYIPPLEEWEKKLQEWQNNGYQNEVDEESRKQFEFQKAQKEVSFNRKAKRERFLQIHGKTIGIASILVTMMLVAVISLLTTIFRPPQTKGLTSEEVVRTYYDALNALDYPLAYDCVGKNVIKDDLNTVKRLYASTNQRQKIFGETGITPAREWLDEGQYTIPMFSKLFGLTDIEIKKISEYEYEVNFDLWYTHIQDDFELSDGMMRQTVLFLGFHVKDRLIMEEKRNHWEIVHIQRTKEEMFRDESVWEDRAE